jgi:TatA/E family protein of Tat protein translocase
MFGSIGPTELILIFVVALLVFGPKKLPEIGKSIGKAVREFRRTSEEIKGRIEEEIQASEVKDLGRELRDQVHDLGQDIQTETKALHDDLQKDLDVHEPKEGQKVS